MAVVNMEQLLQIAQILSRFLNVYLSYVLGPYMNTGGRLTDYCGFAIPYHTIPYDTMPYHTMPYHAIRYDTIRYHTIPYHNNHTLLYTLSCHTQSPSQPLLRSVPNSLPTNGCLFEQHIPFPHLTNKSEPSKIWKVDLHLGMSCLGILMAKYMELAFKKVCDLRLNV